MKTRILKDLLKNGQSVMVHSFGDGIEHPGTICGLSLNDITKIYIVRLEQPNPWTWQYDCITVPEGCLKIVERNHPS